VRLFGVPVGDEDLRRLITTLLHGGADGRTLARRIADGLDRGVTLLALTPVERDVILGALEEAETSALAELRGRLADDAAYRHGLE
jgi:hypothetical protein